MSPNGMSVLVADDEEGIRFVLKELLFQLGYQVTEARDGEEAVAALHLHRFDLALLDINMPRRTGLEVLREARRIDPSLIALVITAYGSPDVARQAVSEGAYDYFTKPFELDELRITIQRALEKKGLLNQIEELKAQVSAQPNFKEIVGVSDSMREVFGIMERVIENDVPVLVSGESGTGKELVAEAIHRRGPRAAKPIVKVNCAAIPEQLLESELFGHERGAFTGAVSTHMGKFEQANGGTLFLDEIGEMPFALQAKILRAVQERTIERVGGKSTMPIDIRLITATNRDLAEEVAAKRFREDLYFRVNVISIHLPPLRQRLADIPILLETFIRQFNRNLGKQVRDVEPAVLERFLEYPWPGNVRELQNAVQRALVMSRSDRITVHDLPAAIAGRETSPVSAAWESDGILGGPIDLDTPMADQVDRAVEAVERRLIEAALEKASGRQEAADLLGISRKSLHNKMLKYDMF